MTSAPYATAGACSGSSTTAPRTAVTPRRAVAIPLAYLRLIHLPNTRLAQSGRNLLLCVQRKVIAPNDFHKLER